MDAWNQIESNINKGEYKGEVEWTKCNIFLHDCGSFHGIKMPKNKDDHFYQMEHSMGIHDELPGRSTFLPRYFAERADLDGSGVYSVETKDISKYANAGMPVLVFTGGHSTMAAPSKEKWPLVYRPDAPRGKDKRIKVGIKKGATPRNYFIDVNEYNTFNRRLKESGFSEFDISNPFMISDDPNYKGWTTLNERYDKDSGKRRLYTIKLNEKYRQLRGK